MVSPVRATLVLADRAIATIGRSNCSSLWPVADVSSASRAPHAKTKGQSSDKSGSTVRFLILCHQLDPTHDVGRLGAFHCRHCAQSEQGRRCRLRMRPRSANSRRLGCI